MGGAASPTSSCPLVPLPEAGSASAEEVNRVGGAAPLPRQGSLSVPASPAVSALLRSQQGQHPSPCAAPAQKPPQRARRRSFMAAELPVPCPEELARQAEPCQPGREPGTAGAPVPAASPGNALFPGELAALSAAPAAPRPAGLRGRGEQVFVITERRRPPVPLSLHSGQGRPLAHASPCLILSRGLFK